MKRQPIVFIAILILVNVISLRLGQATQDQVYAIRNAKIVPIIGAEIQRGTVVIRNGRIAAVGANVSIPGNARVIDASGLAVYPGMIDSGTSIGLTEIGQVRATVDTRELGDFNPHLRAIIAIHPDSELIPVARVNGLTSVVSRPAGGVFSGQAALINLDGWTWEEGEVSLHQGQPDSADYQAHRVVRTLSEPAIGSQKVGSAWICPL